LEDGKSPYQKFPYSEHKEYAFEAEAEPDERILCAPGGSVATLAWCISDNQDANEFMEVSFLVRDIAAIPYASDGKFRVNRFYTERIVNRKKAIELMNTKDN